MLESEYGTPGTKPGATGTVGWRPQEFGPTRHLETPIGASLEGERSGPDSRLHTGAGA